MHKQMKTVIGLSTVMVAGLALVYPKQAAKLFETTATSLVASEKAVLPEENTLLTKAGVKEARQAIQSTNVKINEKSNLIPLESIEQPDIVYAAADDEYRPEQMMTVSDDIAETLTPPGDMDISIIDTGADVLADNLNEQESWDMIPVSGLPDAQDRTTPQAINRARGSIKIASVTVPEKIQRWQQQTEQRKQQYLKKLEQLPERKQLQQLRQQRGIE